MIIGIIIAFIFIGIIIGTGYWASRSHKNDSTGNLVAAIILTIIFALGLLTVPASFHTVDTGEIAVVKHLGDAKTTRTAGTHFDFWLTNKYQIYDAKVQNVDITTAAYSSDAQTMNVEMVVQYQVMTDHVMDIAKQYGSLAILENRIQSIAIEKTKAVLSSYKAMDIIANRSAMSPKVEETIKSAVGDEYFVIINTVVLTNIDFSDAFENAVEEKMIAEQNQLKQEYENEAKIAKAQADADAKLIEAKAEAEANDLLQKSLTEQVLRDKALSTWNGKLPSTVAGENGLSIILGK